MATIIEPEESVESVAINSVAEFLEALKKKNEALEPKHTLFFRGQANKDWKEQPSIFRHPKLIENEKDMFYEIIARCPEEFRDCKNTFEYLVKMQHYGLPTRLLDVTENPLVALYFACQTSQEKIKLQDTVVIQNGDNEITLGAGKELARAKETDGQVSIFRMADENINNYDSDRVVLLANLAKTGVLSVHYLKILEDKKIISKYCNKLDKMCQKYRDDKNSIKPSMLHKLKKLICLKIFPSFNKYIMNRIERERELLKESKAWYAQEIENSVKNNPLWIDFITDLNQNASQLVEAYTQELNEYQQLKEYFIKFLPNDLIKNKNKDEIKEDMLKKYFDNISQLVIYLWSYGEYETEYDGFEQYFIKNLKYEQAFKKIKGHGQKIESLEEKLTNNALSDEEVEIVRENIKNFKNKESMLREERKKSYEFTASILKIQNQIKKSRIDLINAIKSDKPYFNEEHLKLSDLEKIVCVKARQDNRRILQQSGAFFLFGVEWNSTTKAECNSIPDNQYLCKITIPHNKKQDILDELSALGISESHLFPEIDHVASDLKYKFASKD